MSLAIGAPLPPHHTWCEGASALLPAAQVAGILDGDGFVGFLMGSGRIPIPRVELGMRDDDPTPLLVAASVARHIGRSIGHVVHDERRRRWLWYASGTPDVGALLSWLASGPPLSPRGWRRVTAVREATLLLADPWSDRGVRQAHRPGDIARLQQLQLATSGKLWASNPLPSPLSLRQATDKNFGWYLSGFFAADGYVGLRSRTGSYMPTAVISQRIDNLRFFQHLSRRLGIGTMTPPRATLGLAAFEWRVSGNSACLALAEVLSRYPLPRSSPKRTQFDLWKATLTTDLTTQAKEAAYRQLRALKLYHGPRSLCTCAPRAASAS